MPADLVEALGCEATQSLWEIIRGHCILDSDSWWSIGLTGAFRWLVGARARDLEQYRSELARLDAAVDKSARCIRDELATALSERDEALDDNERLCEALSKAKAREAALQDVIKAMAR